MTTFRWQWWHLVIVSSRWACVSTLLNMAFKMHEHNVGHYRSATYPKLAEGQNRKPFMCCVPVMCCSAPFLFRTCSRANQLDATLGDAMKAYAISRWPSDFDTDSSPRSVIRIFLVEVTWKAFNVTCGCPVLPTPRPPWMKTWIGKVHLIGKR